jgi:hypothetical protein
MCSAQAGRGRDCGAKPVPAAPTARFNGGFNTVVRGGYEWGPWRFEEEYSYRQNGARDVVGMLLFGGARLSACSCYRRMIIAPAPRSTAVGYS